MVRFLLVGRPEETAWALVLRQALEPLGQVEVVSEKNVFKRLERGRGLAVIVLDATVVSSVSVVISQLRRQCPQISIVLATASPTWQGAREAFRLGAADYIHKSFHAEALLAAMKDVLARSDPVLGH